MSEAPEAQVLLDALEASSLARIAAAGDLAAVDALSAELLGKKSELVGMKRRMGSLAPEERKAFGQAMNHTRQVVTDAVDARRSLLAAGARAAQLNAERLDLTETIGEARRGHLHVVSETIQRLEDLFAGMGYTVSEGPEVETDWYNFEALNIEEWHPARGMFDSLFVDLGVPESVLLRTHTSPVQIRVMESTPAPIYTIAPGRVFRSDTADATHMPVFHQIEGLVVDRGVTFGDLAGTIEAFTTAYFGESFTSRLRPSYFPFTEPSAEFDISTPDDGWLELGGCGMVHPNVLRNVGLDPEEWSGFAFGFGIDRLAMMRHSIGDMRELWSNDVRFLSQF